jgi:hypothetical protein
MRFQSRILALLNRFGSMRCRGLLEDGPTAQHDH